MVKTAQSGITTGLSRAVLHHFSGLQRPLGTGRRDKRCDVTGRELHRSFLAAPLLCRYCHRSQDSFPGISITPRSCARADPVHYDPRRARFAQ
jgi:hypothetical protein